jgi:3-isopropylmalate/(R)-2-methylmalate dehydratase small subunit
MLSYDPEFAKVVQPGDLLVGGINFGYGHPHYPPIRAIRHLGISGIIAESFSPGFWRGEISNGFPLVPCPGILKSTERWDELTVNWIQGIVVNHRSGQKLSFDPLTQAELEMLETGGLVPYLKKSLSHESQNT